MLLLLLPEPKHVHGYVSWVLLRLAAQDDALCIPSSAPVNVLVVAAGEPFGWRMSQLAAVTLTPWTAQQISTVPCESATA